MSAGGVFKLIANDGKADRLIMATELLNQRLKDIMCMRAKSNFSDPTPTLVDIERTHLLFVNAHFKPFVAIAYEYNKVRSQAGNATYGSSVTFSIPQFGDFFSDMVVNTVLAKTSATVGVVPPLPPFVRSTFQDLVSTTQKISGSSVPTVVGPPLVPGVFTQYIHEYVDFSGDLLTPGAAATNYVRYAEYVGERLFKRVKFDVNGNPLDEYTSEAVMFHRKFRIAPGKLLGWKRLVGQEVPHDAYTDMLTIANESIFPTAATGLTDVTGAAVPGGAVLASVNTRQLVKIVDGPQTPKAEQPALDLWIPLNQQMGG